MSYRFIYTVVAVAGVLAGCEPIEEPENRVVWEPAFERQEGNALSEGQPEPKASCSDDITTWNFTRDDAGRVVKTEFFNRTASQPYRVESYEYDENGLSRFVATSGSDEYSVTIVRDEMGRVIERNYQSNQADRDTTERVVMVTDTMRVVEYEGRVDWLLWKPTFSNLDFDLVSEVNQHLVDADLIGMNLDVLMDIDLSSASNLAEAFINTESDELFMHIRQTIQFDEQGREVRAESEHLIGEQATSVRVTEYTAVEEGQRSEQTVDLNNDGEPEATLAQVHSTDGLLLLQESSGQEDGQPSTETVEWQYDAEGRITIERTVKNGQETVASHAYEGNLWSIDRVSDNVGRADRRTEVYLNDNGNRVLKREIDARDEPPYYQKRYAYDEANRRVFDERDSNMNGEFNERWDYFYESGDQPVWEIRVRPDNLPCLDES